MLGSIASQFWNKDNAVKIKYTNDWNYDVEIRLVKWQKCIRTSLQRIGVTVIAIATCYLFKY